MPKLDKFEIIEELGTGSMGTVYRARDTVLDREVALKTIRTGTDVEPEIRERFYREARACARLQHPHIVVVHELGEVERTAYIAMELLVGSDFRQMIEHRQEACMAAKLEAMAQVCEALAHAHRSGIVHRDIKPSNLFFLQDQRAKVLDFGIARLPSSRLTVAGRILGTPNYMAPEQILCKPSDGRADLFSAAVVFFEFLVYAHPFRSSLIPRRIVEEEPDSLFDHDPRAPALLERVFARALERDPDRRYRTGDEFAADLRAIADAVRQNASPTFSRVTLPSDRALADAPASELAVPSLFPAAGEDSGEWRLSEVLRLVRDFDAAFEARDVAAARKSFDELQVIEKVDPRFHQALDGCCARLAALSPEATPVPRVAPEAGPPTQPKECPYCRAENRAAAAFCIQCGAAFPAATASVEAAAAPVASAPPSQGAATPPPPAWPPPTESIDIDDTLTGGAAPDVPPPPEAPTPKTPEPQGLQAMPAKPVGPLPTKIGRPRPTPLQRMRAGWKPLHTKIALGVGGILVCAAAVVSLVVFMGQPREERSVATAFVRSATANVYRTPDAQGSLIASLPRDDSVNVLELPRGRDQQWVRVQRISGAVLRPGYMQLKDLMDWRCRDAQSALSLARTLGAGENGSDREIEEQVRQLENVNARFTGHPASREALLDAARLEYVLAKRQKEAGQPEWEWRHHAQSAQRRIEGLRADSDVGPGVGEVLAQLEVLAAPPTPAAPPPGAGSETASARRARILKYIDDAKDFRAKRMFSEAFSRLNEALKLDPRNVEAKDLLDKYKTAEAELRGL